MFRPTDYVRRLDGRHATYRLSDPKRPSRLYDPTTARIAFSDPLTVTECVRRRVRREVLHALKKTGRGSGGGKKRRTWRSMIKC